MLMGARAAEWTRSGQDTRSATTPGRSFRAGPSTSSSTTLSGALQAGNAALCQLLSPSAPHGRTPSPRPPVIQRYPMRVLEKPYGKWGARTAHVSSPAEGVKGGVYFLHSQAPIEQLDRVVVKALTGDEGADQSQFGDAFLRTMGIRVPASRIIQKSSPEFAGIAAAGVRTAYDNKVHAAPAVEQGPLFNDAVRAFKLMGAAPGTSVAAMAGSTVTQAQVNSLLALLSDATMRSVARMAVADAAIGNDDRLALQGAGAMVNIGNIISAAGGDLWAIDTAAMLKSLRTPAGLLSWAEVNTIAMANLTDPARLDVLADAFLDAVAQKVAAVPPGAAPLVPPAAQQVADHVTAVRQARRVSFQAGVAVAITDLQGVLRGKAAAQKKAREGLREEAARTYDVGVGKGRASWENLKARYETFEAHHAAAVGGLADAQALAAVDTAAVKSWTARHDDRLDPVVRRVLRFGLRQGLMTAVEVNDFKEVLVQESVADQHDLIHLRGGFHKVIQIGSADKKQRVEARLETARLFLLRRYVAEAPPRNLGVAKGVAARLNAVGIGDYHFMTPHGEAEARAAFTDIGAPAHRF